LSKQAGNSGKSGIPQDNGRPGVNEVEDAAESLFSSLAATALNRIEAALDAAGFEVERQGDGILEVEFDDGSKMVINRHNVAREIWVAARSGGFHFRLDGQRWVDTRTGEELHEMLGRLVSAQGGVAFSFD
jgi:CyaY protein